MGILDVAPRASDGLLGDGGTALFCLEPATVTLTDSFVGWCARVGVARLGSPVVVGGVAPA